MVGTGPAGPLWLTPEARGRARRRRRPGGVHHLPGPGAGPPGSAAARLRQQGGVGARRVRPRPGPAGPAGGRGLWRRPGRVRDGHRRAGGRRRRIVPGGTGTGAARRDGRQRRRRAGRAPLGHDYAILSLSDRLKPWEVIAERLRAAAVGRPGARPLQPWLPQPHLAGGTARDLLLELPGTGHPGGPGARYRRAPRSPYGSSGWPISIRTRSTCVPCSSSARRRPGRYGAATASESCGHRGATRRSDGARRSPPRGRTTTGMPGGTGGRRTTTGLGYRPLAPPRV